MVETQPQVAVGAAKVEEVGINEGDDILGEVGCLERDRGRMLSSLYRRLLRHATAESAAAPCRGPQAGPEGAQPKRGWLAAR